jgi:hypothetical protein
MAEGTRGKLVGCCIAVDEQEAVNCCVADGQEAVCVLYCVADGQQ